MSNNKTSEYSNKWSVFQGNYGGEPISVRLRTTFDVSPHPDYPIQIGIATPLLYPDKNNLTTRLESEELLKIESELEKNLVNNGQAVLAIVITTQGMREFVFYATKSNSNVSKKIVTNLNKKYPHRVLQCMMQED